MNQSHMRVIIAKTSLDGHWRGVNVVAKALRDDGFEVILLGMAKESEIVRAVMDEDPNLVGLNIGGRVEVAQRIIGALRLSGYEGPVVAGGHDTPLCRKATRRVWCRVFPPVHPSRISRRRLGAWLVALSELDGCNLIGVVLGLGE